MNQAIENQIQMSQGPGAPGKYDNRGDEAHIQSEPTGDKLGNQAAYIVVKELVSADATGNCQSCGLAFNADRQGMKIPGLHGYYHSVACVEQAIIANGCQFCGSEVVSNSQRFCSDRCAKLAKRSQFGDCNRTVAWLTAHSPGALKGLNLVKALTPQERVCGDCGASMEGKKKGAIYCSERCKKRAKRRRTSQRTRETQSSQFAGTNTLCSQGVTGDQTTSTGPPVWS